MNDLKIDLNVASVDDLKSINGIGQVRAEAIINARKKFGGFKSVEDLAHVPRLGRSFLEKYQMYFNCRHSTPTRQRATSSTPTTRLLRSSAASRSSLKRKHPSDEIITRSSPRQLHRPQELTRAPASRTSNRAQSNSRISTTNRRLRNKVHSTNRESLGQSSDETEKTPNDIKLDLFLVFGEGSRSNKRSTIVHSSDTNNTSSSNQISTTPHSAQSEGTKPSAEVDSNVSTNHNEEASCLLPSTSLRSKIPVSMENVERHWKKQKLESSSLREDAEVGDMNMDGGLISGSDEACGEASESLSSQAVSKKSRIPSKKNPQPELHGWLGTFQEWGHAEKLLALDELLTLCDPTQVRHVMQVIEPQFQRDFISLLPKELALYVLSFLEPRDLLRAAQTCTYWHSLAEDNLLWREKCQEEGVTETLVYPAGKKGSRSAHAGRAADKNAWKALYLRQKQIEHNWRTSVRSPKVLKGHDDHVITCLEFSGNKIVSGSDDNTLKVWSAVTGRCLRTLTGHTGGVWSSQMSGSIIISGSTDRTLKVWNADTGHCKHTLYGHTSTVRCMHLHNRRVVSGSRDATLRVWDIDSGQCLHILIGHVAAVRCVQYDGHRVISGGYDYMVKIWDPENETCLQTLAGHTNRVYSLQFDGIHIVSGSLDTSIRVWNVETGVCVHTLIGHQSLTSGMELKDNILVSGNADSTVKVWNIMTGQCLQTLQGPNKHQSAVTCLQFNGTLIITSSDDGTVKLWDLKTGEFIRNLVALESGGSGGVVWRIRCNNTKLVCAVGSRNGTEETKLLVIDFDVQEPESSQQSPVVITVRD